MSKEKLSERLRDAANFGPVRINHPSYTTKMLMLIVEVESLEQIVEKLRDYHPTSKGEFNLINTVLSVSKGAA